MGRSYNSERYICCYNKANDGNGSLHNSQYTPIPLMCWVDMATRLSAFENSFHGTAAILTGQQIRRYTEELMQRHQRPRTPTIW
jgi:hypothetical protein